MLGHTFLHISPCQFFYIGTHPLGRGRDYFFITHRFQTGDLLLLRGFLRLLFGVKFRFALGFSRLMLRTLFFFIFCGGELFASLPRRPSKNTVNFRQESARIRREQKDKLYTHKCAVCGRTDVDHPELEFRYCSKCQGYHCFCSDHINNHIHFTE